MRKPGFPASALVARIFMSRQIAHGMIGLAAALPPSFAAKSLT
jgi:hypothetical protein